VGDLKKLVAAQTGTRPEKIRIQKWYTIYKVCMGCSDRNGEEKSSTPRSRKTENVNIKEASVCNILNSFQ